MTFTFVSHDAVHIYDEGRDQYKRAHNKLVIQFGQAFTEYKHWVRPMLLLNNHFQCLSVCLCYFRSGFLVYLKKVYIVALGLIY